MSTHEKKLVTNEQFIAIATTAENIAINTIDRALPALDKMANPTPEARRAHEAKAKAWAGVAINLALLLHGELDSRLEIQEDDEQSSEGLPGWVPEGVLQRPHEPSPIVESARQFLQEVAGKPGDTESQTEAPKEAEPAKPATRGIGNRRQQQNAQQEQTSNTSAE